MCTSGSWPDLKPGCGIVEEEDLPHCWFRNDSNPYLLPKSVSKFKSQISVLSYWPGFIIAFSGKVQLERAFFILPKLELPISTYWQWLIEEYHLTQFWLRYKMNPMGGWCLSKVFSLIKRDTHQKRCFPLFLYFTSQYYYVKMSYLWLLLPFCHQPWDEGNTQMTV